MKQGLPVRLPLLLLFTLLAGQATAQISGRSPQRRLQQAFDNAVTATLSLRGAPALSTPSLAAALMTQLPEATSIQINSVQTRTDANGSVSLATLKVLANSSADADAVATRLGDLTNSTALLDELNAEGVTATDVAVMDISKPSAGGQTAAGAQPAAGGQQAAPSLTRDPNSLSGSALAGVLVVIGIGLLLVITMAGFGIRSLLQIRDEMAKRKAGYKVVELNGDHHGDHLSSVDAKDIESGHYDSDPTAKRS